MTGQDEREVAIRIIAPYVTLVCNDRQGGGLPECEHTTTGRVRSEEITDAILAAGFHLAQEPGATTPSPHTITTVEELEALPVGAVVGSRLASGEWSVATKNLPENSLEDFDWTVDGHGGGYSSHGVEEWLGFPVAVLTPTAEVKAEELAQIIEPLLAAHGTKSRNAYYVRCRCGYTQCGAEGSHPTLHEHKAQVIAKAIATHLRENGGA